MADRAGQRHSSSSTVAVRSATNLVFFSDPGRMAIASACCCFVCAMHDMPEYSSRFMFHRVVSVRNWWRRGGRRVDMCGVASRASSGHRAAASSAPVLQSHLASERRPIRHVVAHRAVRGRPRQRSQRSRAEGRVRTGARPTWHSPGGPLRGGVGARCIMGVVRGGMEGRSDLHSTDDLRIARCRFDSTPLQRTPMAGLLAPCSFEYPVVLVV